MVRKTITISRTAFTMIELIFAIVIISIAVVSLPVMTKITEKGVEENILQEAIFASSAELMGVSSGYWDSRSIEDINVSHISRVIDINASDAIRCDNNNSSPRFRLRLGHIAQPLHRRCLDSNSSTVTAAGADTLGAGVLVVNATPSIFDNLLTNRVGYKNDYKSVMTISTSPTIITNAPGNIKYITASVSHDVNGVDKNITVLRMISANIGEIDYYKRRF